MRENIFRNFILKFAKFISLAGLLLLIASCSESEERPEVIKKLRAIGVSASPAIISESSALVPVQILFHVLIPSDQEIETLEVYKDEVYTFGASLDTLTIDPTPTPTIYGNLKHYVISARASIPATTVFQSFSINGGPVRLRYGLRVVAGSEEEKIVGDLLVVSRNDSSLTWKSPKISIESPSTSDDLSTTSNFDLKAGLDYDSNDSIKIAWFVSSGKIDNRRDSTPKWTDFETGDKVLIATVRGIKSKGFALDIRVVK